MHTYGLDNNIDDSDTLVAQLSDLVQKKNRRTINNYFHPIYDQMLKLKFNDTITKDKLYEMYGNPFIVCMKDNSMFQSCFYEQTLSQEQFASLLNSIEIIPSTYKIMTGSMMKYLSCVSCEKFNSFGLIDKYGIKITVNKDVLICCLLRFKYSNVIRYLKQFEGIGNFIDIYNAIIINEYLGQQNTTSTVRQNHIALLNNMIESNYYTIHNNCQLNITLKFRARGFNLALSERLDDEVVQNVLKRLSESKDSENDDYLSFLFKKSKFLDASSAVDQTKYKLYRISYNPITDIMNSEHFNMLYSKLCPSEKYYLLTNCLISKNLCHFVVNNKFILNEIVTEKDNNGLTFMNKYGQLIRYLFGYSWLTMYIEESIKRTHITNGDRFIFDIETASKLPYFPYSTENIHICPYIPVLVELESINISMNILGVKHYMFNDARLKDVTRFGVCDKDTFLNRVNTFISGKQDVNILDGINWKNIAMSGSIMACCLPNFNSLMLNFIKNTPKTRLPLKKQTKKKIIKKPKDESDDESVDDQYKNTKDANSDAESVKSKKSHKSGEYVNGEKVESDFGEELLEIQTDSASSHKIKASPLPIDFIGYINEYYKDSDIDMMCNLPNIYEFVDKINEFKETIDVNIRKIHNIDQQAFVSSIISNKSCSVLINKNFVKNILVDKLGKDFITIISNVNEPSVKSIVYQYYLQWFKEYLIKSINENKEKFMMHKYNGLYNPASIENINVVFVKTKVDESEEKSDKSPELIQSQQSDIKCDIDDDDIEFEKEKDFDDREEIYDEYTQNNTLFLPKTNYKFRISSSYLPHCFEFFQIRYPEFFSTVARFHLPIVRSYYDGSNIYLTPSCVTACMTLLNVDYKYFAGSKDPIEIINKYRRRGFGTILNTNEIKRLIEYSSLVPKWKELYNLNIKSNSSIMSILGQMDISHPFYKPHDVDNKYKSICICGCKYTVMSTRLFDIVQNIKKLYSTPTVECISLTSLITINNNGFVNPVKKWIIEAFHDYIFNNTSRVTTVVCDE
jgi:hypothetical protein